MEEIERGADDFHLAVAIVGRSERPAHRMSRDESAGHSHQPWYVTETGHIDTNGWYPCSFDRSLYVPHGHVTDRSNRHEQSNVGSCLLQTVCPRWSDISLDAELGSRANERIRVRDQFADDSLVSQRFQMTERKRNLMIGRCSLDRVATVADTNVM